jgi:5-methylcytosine-specific restriction endonuclease McrA
VTQKAVWTPRERKWLLRRLADVHGWFCWYCHLPIGPIGSHIDHVVPRSAGGDDGFFNLALACRQCNFAKHNLTVAEFLQWLEFVKSDRSYCLIGQKFHLCSRDFE